MYSAVLYKAALPLSELDQSKLELVGGHIADLGKKHIWKKIEKIRKHTITTFFPVTNNEENLKKLT